MTPLRTVKVALLASAGLMIMRALFWLCQAHFAASLTAALFGAAFGLALWVILAWQDDKQRDALS
jgi:membrane associated rhomboid family serine protease